MLKKAKKKHRNPVNHTSSPAQEKVRACQSEGSPGSFQSPHLGVSAASHGKSTPEDLQNPDDQDEFL